MPELTWQDPPDNERGHPGRARAWAAQADQLREHPKRWAVLKSFESNTAAQTFATAARKGNKLAFQPVGAWEFRAVLADVYARYVGEEPTDAAQP